MMELGNFSVLELVLIGSFGLVTLIQLVYHWRLFSRLAFYKKKKNKSDDVKLPVSIVIAARNEYYNLIDNLPAIFDQDYPYFEVIVVNHASDDGTDLLLKEFKGKYDNLKVVEIKEDLNFFKGKKFPLSIGIREAKNDILLLTDADCKPSSRHWISNMVSNYESEKTEIVLGYGPYLRKKGFINLLVRYDTFLVALQYLSFALSGKTYMGVGRNLSYRRSLFFKSKGFISHYNLPSGDDDLFISQVANKKNVKVELDKESFVYSKPEESFGNWFRQKKRHLQTSVKYKPSTKFLLGMFSFTQALFYLLFVALLIINVELYVVFGIFFSRFISQVIINKRVTKVLDEKKICAFTILWEPVHIVLMFFIMMAGRLSKKKSW